MTIPQDIEKDLQDVSSLPGAADLRAAVTRLFNLAAARDSGSYNGPVLAHSGLMIASDKIEDAEKLAAVYIGALQKAGFPKTAKVQTIEWQDVFTPQNGEKEDSAMYTNIRQAFKDAAGGVLLVRAPYNGPAGKNALDQKLANYSATSELLYQMDKEEGWDKAFNDLYAKGKGTWEIEREMTGKSYEDPCKPVVILVGATDGMRAMYEEDPSPWGMRFQRRIGVEDPNKKRGYGF